MGFIFFFFSFPDRSFFIKFSGMTAVLNYCFIATFCIFQTIFDAQIIARERCKLWRVGVKGLLYVSSCLSTIWVHVMKYSKALLKIQHQLWTAKGQLNSKWIYEVIVCPKVQTKNYKDFWLTIQTRIVALFLVSVDSFFCYEPCLFGREEILVILGLHFGRNDDLINSFWI